MLTNDWSIALALFREDGTAIGELPIEADWEPARQWVRHIALCHGDAIRDRGTAEVHPIWHRAGSPVMRAFRISVETDRRPGEVSCEFPSTYFSSVARSLSGALIDAGHLAAGDVFRYVALARPRPANGTGAGTAGFVIQDVTPAPALQQASLERQRRRAAAIGDAAADHVPAFAPRRVLDEITTLTKRASPLETGGALVGHLKRDAKAQTVFAVVTAQIPAEHTEASTVRLAFSSDTWGAMRQAIAERGQGEMMLGWWHSHPVREWCRQQQCSDHEEDRCSLAGGCFSEHDRAVHRTVFPAAHSIALVASDTSAAEVTFSVYGWSLGMLQTRGLFVT